MNEDKPTFVNESAAIRQEVRHEIHELITRLLGLEQRLQKLEDRLDKLTSDVFRRG